MKKIAPTAILLLAGCAMNGGYPAAPYPIAGPPPPAGIAPADCPVVQSHGWQAWINAMPGPNANPSLILTGTVVTAAGGYRLAFEPLQFRDGGPPLAFATLYAATDSSAEPGTTHDVRWTWPIGQRQVASLVVRCGGRTLAEIPSVGVAH